MWQLVLIATAGNALGGLSAYYLGRLGDYAKIEKYIGVNKEKANQYKNRLRGVGNWCAFLSFVPIIGDVLLIALGLAKASAFPVIVFMTLGKLLRYLFVASLVTIIMK